jgi:hypothetical protein
LSSITSVGIRDEGAGGGGGGAAFGDVVDLAGGGVGEEPHGDFLLLAVGERLAGVRHFRVESGGGDDAERAGQEEMAGRTDGTWERVDDGPSDGGRLEVQVYGTQSFALNCLLQV